MPSFAFSPAELSYLYTSLSSTPPIRPDSRTATQFRPLNAETNVLASTNGSAHLSFSDGSEAIVGIKLEVEQTLQVGGNKDADDYSMDVDQSDLSSNTKQISSPDWISLTLTLPGVRDDDASLVFLEQMLREPLIAPSSSSSAHDSRLQPKSLQDALIINKRWHWHMYIDVVLISPFSLQTSYPLPLLSLNVYLALCDTRLPRLKSQGEEDPIADDDWEASDHLFEHGRERRSNAKFTGRERPTFTLLVVIIAGNVLFDPSREELAVADAIIAVSVRAGKSTSTVTEKTERNEESFKILAVRMIETPARDTMGGVSAPGEIQEGRDTPGVWRPKVGGLKREILKKVMKAIVGDDENPGGVAREILDGLEGFLRAEEDNTRR